MWIVYLIEDAQEVGFTVGDGTEKDCISFCNNNAGYTYCYFSCL